MSLRWSASPIPRAAAQELEHCFWPSPCVENGSTSGVSEQDSPTSNCAHCEKQLSKDVVAKPTSNAELMERKDRALAIWVKPKLVVEVFYQGFGGQGLLRQPAFKTLRADKTPADLLVEDKDRKRSSRAKKT